MNCERFRTIITSRSQVRALALHPDQGRIRTQERMNPITPALVLGDGSPGPVPALPPRRRVTTADALTFSEPLIPRPHTQLIIRARLPLTMG